MDSVKVDKAELQTVVKHNREKHHATWKAAFDGYRRAVITALENNLEAFKTGRAERVFINESPPEDHTKDYDRVLCMLDMSREDQITLSSESFEQYVLDDWKWKRAWTTSNSKYLASDVNTL